jgi:hypothetical protein
MPPRREAFCELEAINIPTRLGGTASGGISYILLWSFLLADEIYYKVTFSKPNSLPGQIAVRL